MTKIYKYQLDLFDRDSWKLSIKSFVKVLSVINQNGKIVVYVAINELQSNAKSVEFKIIGTGHDIINDKKDDFIFLNTVEIVPFVWHIFYKII